MGELNRGWYVGATLLDFERSNITGAITSRKTIERLINYVHSDEGRERSRLGESVSLRHDVADRFIETEVQFNFSFRIISMQAAGQIPNYEASTSKLFNSELTQKLARTGTQVLGMYAQFWGSRRQRTQYVRRSGEPVRAAEGALHSVVRAVGAVDESRPVAPRSQREHHRDARPRPSREANGGSSTLSGRFARVFDPLRTLRAGLRPGSGRFAPGWGRLGG